MKTKHPRKTSLGKLAAGALVAVGLMAAAGSPAMADNWKHGHGHGKHWKHSHYHNAHSHRDHYYYYQPRQKVVYVQPQPVYVAPPPVYYYQPAPVYRRPEINIVFPLDFD